MDPKVEVSCVIVAFHRPVQLAALVAALESPDIEIVVVNVDDDDDVRLAAGDALVTPLFGDPGYAAAVNHGTAIATGDVIVFVSDDALIDAETVRGLADVVTMGQAAVVVPRIIDSAGRTERTIAALPSPGALIREWLLLPDHPVKGIDRVVTVQKWRLPNKPEVVDAASAVVAAVSRELLRTHPLPEEYFLYWEESDWFWRLRKEGFVVQYRPELECRHDGGRDDVRPDKSRLLARNAVRCVRLTQGRVAAFLAMVVVIAWNARLLLVDSTRALARPDAGRRSRVASRWAGLCAALQSWSELR